MAHNDISRTEPCVTDGIGNSHSSNSSTESSPYCHFSGPSELESISSSQGSKSSSSSEGYASFTEIRDGHQVLPNTQIGNKQEENNKGFISDRGSSDEMEPKKGSLTEMSLHDKTPLGGSGPYAEIRGTDETEIRDGHQVRPDAQIGNKQGENNKYFTSDGGSSDEMEPPKVTLTEREQGPPNDRSYIPGFHSMTLTRTDHPIRPVPHVEDNKKSDTNIIDCPIRIRRQPPGISTVTEPLAEGSKRLDSNINWRRIKPVVLVVVICLSVSALVTIIVANKNVDDPVPTPFTTDEPSAVKCNNQEPVVSPGDRICIPYDLNSTSRISHITMQQTSSTYFYTFFQFNMSVSSTVSHFIRYVDDWIVDYNISRIDQMLRIVQPNSYCSNTGKYIVILEYTNGSNPSFEFEVRMKDPQLNQSITSDDQGIHVHCELTGTCLPGSLAIYVTVNNSTLLVPDTNACSYNDRKTGTMVSIQATIPFSMITKNQSISCVPLMRNQELAENLTNTIPTCDEPECKPNCKDASAINMYYPDYVYCDKFYQCSNGEAIEKTCNISTYWEPTKCTCDHYNTTICNMNNNTRITPLRTLNPCG